jgi:hypothetical protein
MSGRSPCERNQARCSAPPVPTLKPNCLLLVQISRGPLLANDGPWPWLGLEGETYEHLSCGPPFGL